MQKQAQMHVQKVNIFHSLRLNLCGKRLHVSVFRFVFIKDKALQFQDSVPIDFKRVR